MQKWPRGASAWEVFWAFRVGDAHTPARAVGDRAAPLRSALMAVISSAGRARRGGLDLEWSAFRNVCAGFVSCAVPYVFYSASIGWWNECIGLAQFLAF